MKVRFILLGFSFLVFSFFAIQANAQTSNSEVYTGTIVSYGSGFDTRTKTATFNLNINGQTADQQAQRFLNVLQENGQDRLLREIDNQDLGRFSVGARIGVPINVVRESIIDGKRRIFIVFRRTVHFAELRGGYRSVDYPFGVIELFIDPETGKGEGTYIAAAKIRWERADRNNQQAIEIENFATYPARLLGVSLRNRGRAK
jgi:hypothetical protein